MATKIEEQLLKTAKKLKDLRTPQKKPKQGTTTK